MCFLTHFTGTTRGFVEASRNNGDFGDGEGIVGKNGGEVGKLPACTDQGVSWENE